jgi:hypothetical protein
MAVERDKFVAALADEVVFAHVTLGGRLEKLRKLLPSWGVQYRMLPDKDWSA